GGRTTDGWRAGQPGVYLSSVVRRLSSDSHLLQVDQLADAFARQRQQRGKLLLGERRLLGRGLDFNDIAGAGEDEIGVGVGLRILGVIEREDRRSAVHAARDSRDMI